MDALRRMVLTVSIFIGVSFNPMLASAQEVSAQDAVDQYVTGLLATMETIRPLYESDQTAYFLAVENALSSFVDFREVARGVMAKYGQGQNGASEEQMSRFANVFRSSLVEFYGSAWLNMAVWISKFWKNLRSHATRNNLPMCVCLCWVMTEIRLKCSTRCFSMKIEFGNYVTCMSKG